MALFLSSEYGSLKTPPEGPLPEREEEAYRLISSKKETSEISSKKVNESILFPTSGSHLDSSKIDYVVVKYQLPTRNIKGRNFKVYRRLSIKGTERQVWKNLLWKAFFRGIVVDEFIILDYLFRKKYKELLISGLFAVVVEVMFLICKNRKNLQTWNSRLPAARLELKKSSTSNGNPGNQDEQIIAITSKLGLPSKGTDLKFVAEEIYVELKNPPPKSFIGKGYNDHGSLKPEHEVGFEMVNGISDSSSFDEEYLRVLRTLK